MANTDKEMEELFSQRQWDEQGNELAMAPPRAEEPKSEDIFSYDADKFKATINELGIPQDSQDWYYEEYKKRNSPLSGVYSAVDSSQEAPGRKIANILPISVPEGKTGAEAIAEGSWDWAVPGAISGAAEGSLKALEMPGQLAKGQPVTKEEQDAAALTAATMLPTAGVAVGGSLAFDPNTVRMFVGPKSKTYPNAKAYYDRLKGLGVYDEATGRRRDWAEDELRDQTGLTRNPKEGTLVGEISDKGSEITKEFQEFIAQPQNQTMQMPLAYVLKHDDLYDEYPGLKEYQVVTMTPEDVTSAGHSEGTFGWFDKRNKRIVLTPDAYKRDPEEIRSTLLHEIQHYVQNEEGWSGGSNQGYIQHKMDEQFNRLNPSEQEIVKRSRMLLRAKEDLDFYRSQLGDGDPAAQANYEAAQQHFRRLNSQLKERESAYGIDPTRLKQLGDFANLMMSDSYTQYLNNTGETMARLVQNRRNLGEEGIMGFHPFRDEGTQFGQDIGDTMTNREFDAEVNAVDRRNPPPRYAEGGMVMDNLEEAMPPAEATSELPPGAIPEDVADDIDAKVSKGEFIVPANVVRFIGVEKLEGMVQKALSKLTDMEKAGRMGGKKPDEPEFATGGLVAPPSGYTPNVGILGGMDQEYQEFQGPNGEVIKVPTKGGQPVTQPPAGYKPISKDGGAPAGQDKTGGMLVTRPSQDGTGRDPTKVGLNKDVGDWSVDDFDTYGKSKSTPQGRVGSLAARSIASVMGLGGVVDKAAAHKDKLAQKAMDQMLSTGKDAQGNPLSPEQLESVKSAKSATTAQHAPTTAEKVMGAAVNVARGGLAGKSLVGSVVDEAKAQVSEKLTGSRNPVKGLVGRVTDPIKAGIKDAINTTYGQRKDATQTSEDKDKKDEGSESGGNRGSDKDSATTSSSTSTASATSSGTRSSDPGRDN